MDDFEHIKRVLSETKTALKNKDSSKLKELSNQTIHSASIYQDAGSVIIAVLIYTLSKLIERKFYEKTKNWDKFVNRVSSFFDLGIRALSKRNQKKFVEYLFDARKSLTNVSVSLKPYIEDVIRKASINKASKLYEHGISLGQTAQVLGITEWELSEYTGQSNINEHISSSEDVRKRILKAMEFFS